MNIWRSTWVGYMAVDLGGYMAVDLGGYMAVDLGGYMAVDLGGYMAVDLGWIYGVRLGLDIWHSTWVGYMALPVMIVEGSLRKD